MAEVSPTTVRRAAAFETLMIAQAPRSKMPASSLLINGNYPDQSLRYVCYILPATVSDGLVMTRMLLMACAIAVQTMASAQVTQNPWFGTWQLRLKAAGEKPETLVYSDAGNGAMRMVSVEENSVIVTRFDGKPASDIGPRGSGEPTLAVKAISPTSYTWTFYQEGKPYVRGINTLAADLKMFTEVSWLITEPGKTVTLTYDRR